MSPSEIEEYYAAHVGDELNPQVLLRRQWEVESLWTDEERKARRHAPIISGSPAA